LKIACDSHLILPQIISWARLEAWYNYRLLCC
jgi:hypothetical protein